MVIDLKTWLKTWVISTLFFMGVLFSLSPFAQYKILLGCFGGCCFSLTLAIRNEE